MPRARPAEPVPPPRATRRGADAEVFQVPDCSPLREQGGAVLPSQCRVDGLAVAQQGTRCTPIVGRQVRYPGRFPTCASAIRWSMGTATAKSLVEIAYRLDESEDACIKDM